MVGGRKGTAVLLFLAATISLLAIVALADDGGATVTGSQPPAWGGNWYIDQDTVATDETIRMDGDIVVNSPYTLSLDGCTVIFNNTFPGSNEIQVNYLSVLYINSTTHNSVVKANTTSQPWGFDNYGEVYMDGAELYEVYNGIDHGGTYLSVENSIIEGYERGVDAYRSDFHLGNSTIKAMNMGFTTSLRVYAVYAYHCVASLHNLNVMVDIDMEGEYSSYYYYQYVDAYGLYLSSATVGKLHEHPGKEFKVSMDIDLDIDNNYSSSYAYLRTYWYTRAVYATGDTILREIDGIEVHARERLKGEFHFCTYRARMYVYNRQQYIYSSIGSSGEAPIDIDGVTVNVTSVEATGSAPVARYFYLYEYMDSYGMYFGDNDAARADSLVTTFTNLHFKDCRFGWGMYMPRYDEWRLETSTFEDLMFEEYVVDAYRGKTDYYVGYNTFRNVTAMDRYSHMMYFYDTDGEGTITNNTFDDVEGWTLLYLNNVNDKVYFQNNEVKDCLQWDYSYDPWIDIYRNDERIFFIKNHVHDNDFGEGMLLVERNYDKVEVETNTFEDNVMGEYLIKSRYADSDLEVSLNTFQRNTGRLIWYERNWERVIFDENDVMYNDAGADHLIYTSFTEDVVRMQDNDVEHNTADGAIVFLRGMRYYSQSELEFTRNTFSNNTASKASNGGVVVLRGARHEVTVRRNNFYDNVGNCINFYRPYQYNNWYSYSDTHTVDGCIFLNNDGAATLWVDYTTYKIEVKRNDGSGNTGPLVKTMLTAGYVYDYSGPDTVGQMVGAMEYRVESNSWTNNTGGGIDIQAQWVDAGNPYTNEFQTVVLRSNDLWDNTGGWAIRVEDFGLLPQLHNNNFDGCTYGVFLQAIDYPAIFDRYTMGFESDSFDGGPNGMTAWGFVNMEADFYNSTFLDYEEAIYARDGTVNVYWCSIPEASGRTEGKGYIYVFNHLEILITWTDASGVESGAPVVEGTLAMLGTNGRYAGELTTDEDGRIGPLLMTPWSSVEGKMDAWSPYQGSIFAGGLTAHHRISVVGEQMGDTALHLHIQDTAVPEVTITTPFEGSISNLVDLPIEGFLFEAGSGIHEFEAVVDGNDGVPITPMMQWSTVLAGLSQGEHTLVVEVMDTATNAANSSVSFVIDSVPPTVDITTPEDGDVTRESSLLVQFSFSDDVSDLSEIVVRINTQTIPSSTGVINEYITLREGTNTILIDATDKAGNVRSEVRTVTLDTYPPTLYVYSPLDELVTADKMLTVDGLSEAGTPITIRQIDADTGEEVDSVDIEAEEDGTFLTGLVLQEGEQLIDVKAKDEAGNERIIIRTVWLDTTPPALFIDSPEDGAVVNRSSVALVGHIEDPVPELVVVRINGLIIEHSGVFTRTVPLMEGLNTIEVTATDPIDNIVVETLEVTRDTIAPELEVYVPEYVLTNERMLAVTGEVNEDAQVVKVAGETVNLDDQLQFSTEVDLSTTTAPFLVEAIDEAMNVNTYVVDFTFDDERPEIAFSPSPPAKISTLVMYINGTVSDNKAIILTVTVQGMVYSVVDGKFNILLDVDTSGDGWNNFTVEATDDAGNTAVKKVSTRYVAPEDADGTETEPKEDETDWLTYVGILLLIAAIVLIATIYVFASRGEER